MRITLHVLVAIGLVGVPCSLKAQAPPYVAPTDTGVYALIGDSMKVQPGTLQNAAVDGISLRQNWSEVEPSDGVYNFAYLDANIQAAQAAGKLVAISVAAGEGTPSWLFAEGAQGFKTIDPSAGCQSVEIPIPWDPVFLSKWSTFIQSLGAHYAGTAIGRVQITGINLRSEEITLPANTGKASQGCTTSNDVQSWQNAGYTAMLVKNAWTEIVAAFAGAFPQSKIVPSILPTSFPPIDDAGNLDPAWANLDTQLVQISVGQYPTQFGLQNNALSDFFIMPLVTSFTNTLNTGHQLLWFATGDASCRLDQGVKPCDAHADLLQAVNSGIQGGADYLEIYQTDILNPALADIISLAHQQLAAPSFEFTAPTYTVVEGTPSATITVQRTRGTALAASVQYATSEGTADTTRYTPTSGTLTFAAGVSTRTFAVPITNDTAYEGNQTVMLSLSSPSAGTILGGQDTSVLTIQDDDAPGAMQFSTSSYSVSEGGLATITVTRSGGIASGVSVAYAASNGTATAPKNYAASSGVLNFAAGQTSATFTVQTNASGVQGNLTVGLTLSKPQGGGSLGTVSSAVLTILASNPVYEFSGSGYSVTQAGPTALITVTRTGSTAGTGSVNYATADGTAKQGVDYTAASGTLVFAAGISSQTFSVLVTPTTTFQPTLTVLLSLSGPSAGGVVGAQGTSVLSITNAYPAGTLSLSAAAYSVSEVGQSITITVIRSGGTASGVSVHFKTTAGTAQSGRDYLPPSGSAIVRFGAGVTSQSFVVTILNDPTPHPDRTLTLSIGTPGGGATLGTPKSAPLTILTTNPVIQFSASSYSVAETGKQASITVVRSRNLAAAVTVQCATSDGTAKAPANYTSVNTTLSFAAGVSSATCVVPINDNHVVEGSETVNLTLSNPGNGAELGAPSTAVLTIGTDDPVVQFSLSAYSVSEASGSATIAVSLTGSASQSVSVKFATTSGGTGVAGQNYISSSGTLTFAPGQTTQNFSVPILRDLRQSGNKTVVLALSGVSGGLLGANASATLTIADADVGGILQFSTANFSATQVAGGFAAITVTRTGGTGQISVAYATSDGTATAGTDYQATSGSVILSQEQPQTTFVVPILAGTPGGPAKTVNLALSSPGSGSTLGTPANAILWLVQE